MHIALHTSYSSTTAQETKNPFLCSVCDIINPKNRPENRTKCMKTAQQRHIYGLYRRRSLLYFLKSYPFMHFVTCLSKAHEKYISYGAYQYHIVVPPESKSTKCQIVCWWDIPVCFNANGMYRRGLPVRKYCIGTSSFYS